MDTNKINSIEKHMTRFKKFNNFLYEKPYIKVPLFILAILLVHFFTSYISNVSTVNIINLFIYLTSTIYLIFFVIYLVGKSFKTLLTANNIVVLIISYMLFMFSITLFFSSIYDMSERFEKGYLTYGTCSDKFDKSMINTDNQKSKSYFYFSSVTLYTVGYGDICPMGLNKTIAITNAFTGNFINVILMVLVISNYLDRKKPVN